MQTIVAIKKCHYHVAQNGGKPSPRRELKLHEVGFRKRAHQQRNDCVTHLMKTVHFAERAESFSHRRRPPRSGPISRKKVQTVSSSLKMALGVRGWEKGCWRGAENYPLWGDCRDAIVSPRPSSASHQAAAASGRGIVCFRKWQLQRLFSGEWESVG